MPLDAIDTVLLPMCAYALMLSAAVWAVAVGYLSARAGVRHVRRRRP
jgi:ABC-type uncharacterized transport system permease subunit